MCVVMPASFECPCAGDVSYSWRVYPDPIDAGAGRNVKRLLVGIAEADVRGYFRRPYGTEVFAIGRDNPHAARSRFEEVSFGVNPQPVGDAWSGLLAHVDEQLSVGKETGPGVTDGLRVDTKG